MATATFIRKLEGTWQGDARLYRCDPPIKYRETYDGPEIESAFAIVSGVYAMFSGPETYIFPASESGKVVDWGELEGSFRGPINHAKALRFAGYEVAE